MAFIPSPVTFTVTPLEAILSVISGVIVGFSLGLIGGGGSILAIPLLLYFVGLAYTGYPSNFVDHLAIGTTALAVGLNAYINSYMHFKRGNVKVKQGILFAMPGVFGSVTGGVLAHFIRGGALLFGFGIVMIGIALLMLKGKDRPRVSGRQTYSHSSEEKPSGSPSIGVIGSSFTDKCVMRWERIIPTGFGVGLMSGLFGIGGGFLIVPGLLFSTGLCMIRAIGTSLIAVGTFGITSAATYAFYGDLSVEIAVLYLLGGIGGGYLGSRIASRMPNNVLRKIFSIIIILVAIYIMVQNYKAI